MEKYIDLTKCRYDVDVSKCRYDVDVSKCRYDMDELSTAPIPVESCSSQTGLQQSILLGRLPWYTSISDVFESHLELIKVWWFVDPFAS